MTAPVAILGVRGCQPQWGSSGGSSGAGGGGRGRRRTSLPLPLVHFVHSAITVFPSFLSADLHMC